MRIILPKKSCLILLGLLVLLSACLNTTVQFDGKFAQRAQALQSSPNLTASYLSQVNGQNVVVEGSQLSGTGVVIGVFDSGVNLDNSELINPDGSSKIVSQACFGESDQINTCNNEQGKQAQNKCSTKDVGCFHGMAVAGFAAGNKTVAKLDNGQFEVGGVAPDSRLSYVRQAMDKAGTIKYTDFVSALNKFVNDVATGSPNAPAVINLSLSFPRSAYPDCEQDNEIKRSIDFLVNAGVVVVAATGNDSLKDSITYPACMKNVIAVGSSGFKTDVDAKTLEVVSSFSNMSDDVNLVAPGEQQWAISPPQSEFIKVSGTSFAAPMVSGAVALLKQQDPSITPERVAQVLYESGDAIVDPANGKTYKRLNVQNAVLLASGNTVSRSEMPVEKISTSPKQFDGSKSQNTKARSVQSDTLIRGAQLVKQNKLFGSTDSISYLLMICLAIGGLVKNRTTKKARNGSEVIEDLTEIDLTREHELEYGFGRYPTESSDDLWVKN